MIKLLSIGVFLFTVSSAYCQYKHELLKDTSWYTNSPPVILKTDNQIFPPSRDYIIDYAYMVSTKPDKSEEYIRIAGESIKIIQLRKGVKLLDLCELYTKISYSPKKLQFTGVYR